MRRATCTSTRIAALQLSTAWHSRLLRETAPCLSRPAQKFSCHSSHAKNTKCYRVQGRKCSEATTAPKVPWPSFYPPSIFCFLFCECKYNC